MRKAIEIGDYVEYNHRICRVLTVDPYTIVSRDGTFRKDGLREDELQLRLPLFEGGRYKRTFAEDNTSLLVTEWSVRDPLERALPITREFIEGLGFSCIIDDGIISSYKKPVLSNNIMGGSGVVRLFWSMADGFVTLELLNDDGEFIHYLADMYSCTTQSELRFLLSKGRVDATK